MQFYMLSLVLVGIGWNFGFIGSTALLSTVYKDSEKFKIQAINDTAVFGCASFSVLVAGYVYDELGKLIRFKRY